MKTPVVLGDRFQSSGKWLVQVIADLIEQPGFALWMGMSQMFEHRDRRGNSHTRGEENDRRTLGFVEAEMALGAFNSKSVTDGNTRVHPLAHAVLHRSVFNGLNRDSVETLVRAVGEGVTAAQCGVLVVGPFDQNMLARSKSRKQVTGGIEQNEGLAVGAFLNDVGDH